MQKYDDAMLLNFSGLSKNARYQEEHRDDLIKKLIHPSFEREALKVRREKKFAIKDKFAQGLDRKLNQ
jgi:hypothetical protein